LALCIAIAICAAATGCSQPETSDATKGKGSPVTIEIVGVYAVQAPEPCHLVEVRFANPPKDFDWGKVAQEAAGRPRSDWQAVYDEQRVSDEKHWVFFFHYLDFSKPLLSPFGPLTLPPATDSPDHLKSIKYDPP
jgi:hypothetical protein